MLHALLFFPTPFFFAMTYHAGHSRKDGDSKACQTAKRALLSRQGVFMGFSHLAVTLIASILLVIPGTRKGVTLFATSAAAGLGVMVCARTAHVKIEHNQYTF